MATETQIHKQHKPTTYTGKTLSIPLLPPIPYLMLLPKKLTPLSRLRVGGKDELTLQYPSLPLIPPQETQS